MERRKFIRNTLLTSMGTSMISTGAFPFSKEEERENAAYQFNLKYAPHDGMFKNNAGDNIISQLEFMADQGFTAFEDNEMRNRPIEQQNAMAKVMEKRGIEMGVFVAHTISWSKPNLTSGAADLRAKFLQEITDAVEVAKRVNAKWMTVVPGFVDLRVEPGYQTAYVVESLKQACKILEPHNLVIVLEALNYMNHPGLFLHKTAQAYEICKAVDSPSCKILYDIYHMQISEGNLIPNIDTAWDEIAYFQIGDNPGRNEPTTGEINYQNIFKHIYNKGYKGILGMEHGNSKPGKAGEIAVIDAYKKVDTFL
ncbi:hydroxypyruvate isomerase family protein [Zhouia sp. PK063]|uniref:hydroxypyruvate isomerase family protein n=1 Tax=Zhouia sp. PK063 TaxID=3373602 RepID=UPI0037A06C1F